MTVYYVCVCIYYLCVCVYIGNLATFSCVLQFNVCVHVYMYVQYMFVCLLFVYVLCCLFVSSPCPSGVQSACMLITSSWAAERSIHNVLFCSVILYIRVYVCYVFKLMVRFCVERSE